MTPVPALSRRRTSAALALVIVLMAAFVLAGCGGSIPKGSATYSGGSAPTDAAALAPAKPVTDLTTITVAQLPPEAVTTLRLIASNGPFPYSKDGVTFSNREGVLPSHPSGWYHEYTVVTPGSSDRGARRIVTGKDGGRFYTDDHYASFDEVVSGVSS
jgi:ribonuclease T1